MNQVSTFDPFADVFPGLLRGFVTPASRVSSASAPTPSLKVRIDVTETDSAYTVRADMPGVRKEDIDVQIDGAQVSISTQVEAVATAEGEQILRSERYSGAMSRSFTLGAEINEEASLAKFENGVLELTLPKKEAPAAKRLAIN